MEKDWMEQLQSQLKKGGIAHVRVDGQTWTLDSTGPSPSLTNQFGNTESFATSEQMITSLQSRFENPVIVVL